VQIAFATHLLVVLVKLDQSFLSFILEFLLQTWLLVLFLLLVQLSQTLGTFFNWLLIVMVLGWLDIVKFWPC
jgi:hypothetical protein